MASALGDAEAYGELVRRHHASLRAFLWRLAGDPTRAEDLAQDAMMRGFQSIGRFRGGSAFRTWLFAIAYREFLQDRRRAGAAGRLEERLAEAEVDAPPDPAAALDLQRALRTLTTPERAAVLLCDACGMSHGETARAMEAPLGSVKTYVKRGRAKLQAALTLPEDRHDR